MKILTKLILAGLLTVSSLNASELLFDLRAQDFSQTLKDTKNARYKVNDKIIIETNLIKSGSGFYYTNQGRTGAFNLSLATQLSNWKLDLDVIYDSKGTHDYKKYLTNNKRLIKLSDISGETFILEFYYCGFTINGKEFKSKINEEKLQIGIKNENNKLTVSINGQSIYEESNSFGKLRFIDTSYINFQNNCAYDQLNGITLVSND